ncbi:MAG: hypothetical protein R3F55_11820 [Alphaproteobacteria bacterium]
MRIEPRKTAPVRPLAISAGLVLALGSAACVPGGIRISAGGFGFSTNALSLFGNSLFAPGTAASGQSLPTAVNGPREVAATFHNEVDCDDRIGLNLGEGFLDPASGSCFACPQGYVRDLATAIDQPAACRPQAGVGILAEAEDLGMPGCEAGTFQIDDACYSCPADMTPTGNDDVGTACLTAE